MTLKEWFESLFSKTDTPENRPTPNVPTPKPIGGLLSVDLYKKKEVAQIFANSIITSALSTGVINIQKEFGLNFPCVLNLNSDQKFSLGLKNNTIVLEFHDTYPVLNAEKLLQVTAKIDAVYINVDSIVISLINCPDFTINLK